LFDFFRVAYYFNRNSLITKSLFAGPTLPFLRRLRLRLVDFFVKMCRLKAFWKVISPVPVTRKRFLALELVLTFGILSILILHPAGAPEQTGNLWSLVGNMFLDANDCIRHT